MLAIRQLTRTGIEPFDLDLTDGECVSLRGPSGAGKTILLRAIADLDPSEGTVSLDGVDRETIPAPRWRRNVCYMPAEPGWWADTAADHFEDRPAACALLSELGLPAGMLDHPLSRLSTGERQRLALARMVQFSPRVLLLDEPTSALDAETTARVEAVLRKQTEHGAAILLVTHDREQAPRMARRHFVIDTGRVSEAAA